MTEPPPNLHRDANGVARCPWGASTDDYIPYHDNEWGIPATDDRTLFEKLCLEGFQSGLSWLTILRKREGFRQAFDDFDPKRVAAYNNVDVDRLLGDIGIIRHRGKIEATINNAKRTLELWNEGRTLADLMWSFEPTDHVAPTAPSDVPGITKESTALSKELKRRGFNFVGPTTAYAAMQAMGMVNDHLIGCVAREGCLALRSAMKISSTGR